MQPVDFPFDATTRKRIYLLRHAEAGYFDDSGQRIADSRLAQLTFKGEDEARALGTALNAVSFDRAVCSGLPRTVATAKFVLGARRLVLEIDEAFQELRGSMSASAKFLKPHEIAYAMFTASLPDSCFYGGERFDQFHNRVSEALTRIVATEFKNLLLVCHGGTNRAILSSLLGCGLSAFGQFEQDSACVNIIDLDVANSDESDAGAVRRVIFRGINMVPGDIAKDEKRATTLEGMTARTLTSHVS